MVVYFEIVLPDDFVNTREQINETAYLRILNSIHYKRCIDDTMREALLCSQSKNFHENARLTTNPHFQGSFKVSLLFTCLL